MNRNGFGVQIIVDGCPLPEYEHSGKTYFAAPWNRDYAVRILTPGYARYLAVGSVDGLDIMTGKVATREASGYVIEARNADIPGFRLNNSEVARFRFGDRSDSYAAQMDKPANIGVIGFLFFSEREDFNRRMLSMGPSRGGATRGGGTLGGGATRGGLESTSKGGFGHDMGTEFGRREEHRVETVRFNKGSQLASVVLEYASEDKLRAAGIIRASVLGEDVNPFPGDGPGCEPPPNWPGRR